MGLRNAPSEFQNIMNNILSPYSNFTVVYLGNILKFPESLEKHIKHLKTLKTIINTKG